MTTTTDSAALRTIYAEPNEIVRQKVAQVASPRISPATLDSN